MAWPPDFSAEDARRAQVKAIIRSTPDPVETAEAIYTDDCVAFINDCCVTYDPRNPSKKLPAKMPFIPFKRQVELVGFVGGLMRDQSDGIVEKSRDMGATWICCAISVWMWRYEPGSSIGWGSRKEQLVDKLGDPDSIFEKIRIIIRNLPEYVVPKGFSEKEHLHYMKCVNPDNDSTITGEAGNNIGRGGRKSIYFKDESAHYERPELIEASLGDNTNVQVDISSVYGEGTVFHRKRLSGIVRPFIMDWRDHPAKDQAWYDARKAKADSQGLGHIFSQEVDRDYAASVEGIFIPSEWVKASLDAHIVLGFEPAGKKRAGQDVADEGGDKNALIGMHGQVITHIDQWAEGDTGVTAKKAWNYCKQEGVDELTYDSIGVGAGFKAKTNELSDMPENAGLNFGIAGFQAGGKVVNPDGEFSEDKQNRDMFADNIGQAMWVLRQKFHNTYLVIVKGKDIPVAELISIDSTLDLANDLVSEISRPKIEYDAAGKIRRESKKNMKKRGIISPNLLDGLMMCGAPRSESDMGALLSMALGANG
ncbi:MAG: hypothetical protein KAR42_15675 [candidate division Zixibacteria bacterium]|nr:hypothetical protein [candidate division Zixibacteria bacterium]